MAWRPTKETRPAFATKCRPIPRPAGAPPAPAGSTPPEGRNPSKVQPHFPQKSRKELQIPLDIASYKLYYVNQEIGLNPRLFRTPVWTHSSPSPSPTSCLRFSRIFVGRVRT